MKHGSVTLLKITVLLIGMITLALCIFALPPLAESAAMMNPEYAHLQYPVLIGINVTAVPFFFALYQAWKLLKWIDQNNAFSELAVKALGMIRHCATGIIILYIFGMITLGFQNALHPGIALIGFAILYATLIIFLFSTVLRELLRNALKMISENDLTV